MQYSGVEIEKIEIRRVPRGVRVTLEERGSEIKVNTKLRWWQNGSTLPHSVNHSKKILVISLTDMRNDEEGTVTFRVPRGYKRKTNISKR